MKKRLPTRPPPPPPAPPGLLRLFHRWNASLVTEQGERNLWDDILDEQLSKCRPFVFSKQRSSTGTANGHTFTGDVSEDDSEYSRSRAGVESRRRTTDGRRKEETSDTVPQEKKSKERAGAQGLSLCFPRVGRAPLGIEIGITLSAGV